MLLSNRHIKKNRLGYLVAYSTIPEPSAIAGVMATKRSSIFAQCNNQSPKKSVNIFLAVGADVGA